MKGPDALTRLSESQKAAVRAARRAKVASTCALAETLKGLCRRGGRAARHPVRYRGLLFVYRLWNCWPLVGWSRIAQVRPAGRLRSGSEAVCGLDTLVKH